MSRAGKEPLAVGVVGAGALGKEHIRRLCAAVAGVRVALVAEPGEENAARVRESWGIKTVPGGQELIASPAVEAVDGGIEAVAFHDKLKGCYKDLARALGEKYGVPILKHQRLRNTSDIKW